MKKTVLCLLGLLLSIPCFPKDGKTIIAENGLKNSVDPLLTTQWAQDGWESAKLPELNVVTGCGATAMAQLMNFWKYPAHGISDNYYVWETTQGDKMVLYADFQNTSYDWENMLPSYKKSDPATQQEIDAVSTLMLHAGIALEMKYDVSTPTQIEYIHTVLKRYFGYNSNSRLLRYVNSAYSMDEWLTFIYKELSDGRPVLMGGTSASGGNHIFVADGYDEDGKVHLNLGHANRNNENQYYDLTRTDQTYTKDMRMIVGVCPETMEAELTTVNVTTPGRLIEALGGQRDCWKICRLKLSGKLNKTDIGTLSQLSAITTGQLSYIDLSECEIDGNELPSGAFSGSMALQEIILPDNLTKIGSKAFGNCTGLYKVHLPENLKEIESFAFSNCRYLGEVRLPKTLSKVGNNPFRYDKLDTFEIEDNAVFTIVNHALMSKDGKTFYSMPFKCFGDYVIPDGTETIGRQAFMKSCMIKSVTLPASVKDTRGDAFCECHSLKDVYCYSTTAPALDIYWNEANEQIYPFDPEYKDCTLHVPTGCIEEYKKNDWDKFAVICDDLPNESSSVNALTFDKERAKHLIKFSLLPDSDWLNITAGGKTIKNVIVSTLNGVKMISCDTSLTKVTIDVSMIPTGIYVVSVATIDSTYSRIVLK